MARCAGRARWPGVARGVRRGSLPACGGRGGAGRAARLPAVVADFAPCARSARAPRRATDPELWSGLDRVHVRRGAHASGRTSPASEGRRVVSVVTFPASTPEFDALKRRVLVIVALRK